MVPRMRRLLHNHPLAETMRSHVRPSNHWSGTCLIADNVLAGPQQLLNVWINKAFRCRSGLMVHLLRPYAHPAAKRKVWDTRPLPVLCPVTSHKKTCQFPRFIFQPAMTLLFRSRKWNTERLQGGRCCQASGGSMLSKEINAQSFGLESAAGVQLSDGRFQSHRKGRVPFPNWWRKYVGGEV